LRDHSASLKCLTLYEGWQPTRHKKTDAPDTSGFVKRSTVWGTGAVGRTQTRDIALSGDELTQSVSAGSAGGTVEIKYKRAK
jgi:hypothetical protein